MAIRKINEVQKVVLIQTKTSKGGKGGVNQPIPKDVKIESLGKAEEEEGEEEEKDGQDQQGQQEGGDKEGDSEKKEIEGDEKEEGAGDDEKGEGGEDGEKGEGEGESEGEGGESEGQGKGKSQSGKGDKGKGSGDGDPEQKDIEKIQKQAEELLNKIKGVDETHQQCGSVGKRDEKQNKEGVDKDVFNEQEKFTRERIKAIMDEEAASGKDHPLRDTGGYNRGEGKEGGGGPRGEIIVIPTRKPDFLRKMKQFAEKEYEKQYYKKGTDWLYTQSYENVVFKDRPKVALPKKSLYILIDVSGSMSSNVDRTGQTILEYVIGYLPTIAADFVGEVWWMSDGILRWSDGPDKGKPAISQLSDFKGKSGYDMTKFYTRVENAKGSGGGTVFNVEFQAIQKIREKEKHNAPIIAFTDGYIDTVAIKYEWPLGSKNMITGKLPPNTYMMCFKDGVNYLKGYYSEDVKEGYFSFEKNIQYYDLSENGRFSTKK